MTRSERVERRLAIIHAVKDGMVSLVLYGMTWIVFMMVISKMLKIM